MKRNFTGHDQTRFATWSGDANPIHLDKFVARRTLMGRPVVHGIHTLLWALDRCLAETGMAVGALSAEFLRPVFVGEAVVVDWRPRTGGKVQLLVSAGAVTLLKAMLSPGEVSALAIASPPEGVSASAPPMGTPRAWTLEQMSEQAGQLPLNLPSDAAAAFPALHAAWGGRRLAALLALSRLVGMDCPGLSSLFAGLRLGFGGSGPADLSWRVTESDVRFRLVHLAVATAGLAGQISAFHRPDPVVQPAMVDVQARVPPLAYARHCALVVGGSRGIGEVIAKIIAAGGGEVILTWASGRADGERVAAEIKAAGGRVTLRRLDVRRANDPPDAWSRITHLYYCATPKIFDRRIAAFDERAFDGFADFYVGGFARLFRALAAKAPGLVAFYPSSTAIDEQLPQLIEYAAAKAAGEALCPILEKSHPGSRILVSRLPRLATDQTVTMEAVPAVAPLEELLPLVARCDAAAVLILERKGIPKAKKV